MSTETNREPVEEPNPEITPEAQPHEGGEVRDDGQATAPESPESAELTPEQTQELLAFRNQLQEANITSPKDFYADYTRKSQAAAEAQRQVTELSEWKSQVESALYQQQQAQIDPVQAAWDRYDQTYDPADRSEAMRLWREQVINEAAQKSMQLNEVQRAIQETSSIGGVEDPAKIAQLQASLSPAEQVEAVQYIAAKRAGKLRDVLNETHANREAEALKRKKIDDLLGSGSPGVVPGSLESQEQSIDLGRFLALAPSARKRQFGTDKWDELQKRS